MKDPQSAQLTMFKWPHPMVVVPAIGVWVVMPAGAHIIPLSSWQSFLNTTLHISPKAWAMTLGVTLFSHVVQWVKTARWVVDGNCWTSSGVSAGIDATLAWISSVYGEEMARQVAIWMEYERNADPSHDPFAEIWGEGIESPDATQ